MPTWIEDGIEILRAHGGECDRLGQRGLGRRVRLEALD
jgi:hypothetical protein